MFHRPLLDSSTPCRRHANHVLQKSRSKIEQFFDSQSGSVIVVASLTALAFALRFYKIGHPDQVVYVLHRSNPPRLADPHLAPRHSASMKSISANSQRIISRTSTTSTFTHLSPSSSLGWRAGSLGSMALSSLRISATATQPTTCRMSECGLCPPFSEV